MSRRMIYTCDYCGQQKQVGTIAILSFQFDACLNCVEQKLKPTHAEKDSSEQFRALEEHIKGITG